MQLGCIADDFTGATDLANNLVRQGMRVIQTIGIPESPLTDDVDAVVVALKSRTWPAEQAIEQSVRALHWLQSQGARQCYFKICSTFDSTSAGNIGPVTQALMGALGADLCLVTPAFPENARTVFKGHLFVGDVLLSESGMRDHPLTPMTDANLVRVMQAQSTTTVGLIEYATVAAGEVAILQRMTELRAQGIRIAIVDAISNADLMQIGRAARDLPLVTAGSGLAIGLPQNLGIEPSPEAARLPAPSGRQAIIAGSCSLATQAQVTDFVHQGGAAFAIDPQRLARGDAVVEEALQWAKACWAQHDAPVLIYSTQSADAVRAVQQALGRAEAGLLIERALADLCTRLVACGVGQLVIAGGETSGACVQALGIQSLRIGPQIDPGVPWCLAHRFPGPPLHLALKSGNFGATDFFTRSLRLLACPS
jgi:uncharacterized protein YgbK (DUF1537 family)